MGSVLKIPHDLIPVLSCLTKWDLQFSSFLDEGKRSCLWKGLFLINPKEGQY